MQDEKEKETAQDEDTCFHPDLEPAVSWPSHGLHGLGKKGFHGLHGLYQPSSANTTFRHPSISSCHSTNKTDPTLSAEEMDHVAPTGPCVPSRSIQTAGTFWTKMCL